MKPLFLTVSIVMLIALKGFSEDVSWPRQLTNEGSVLTLYQPQVQSWEQYKKLTYRMAFSLTPNQGKVVLGVLYMQSATDVNMDDHTVLIYDMVISKTNFPSLDADNAGKMDK